MKGGLLALIEASQGQNTASQRIFKWRKDPWQEPYQWDPRCGSTTDRLATRSSQSQGYIR